MFTDNLTYASKELFTGLGSSLGLQPRDGGVGGRWSHDLVRYPSRTCLMCMSSSHK